MPKTVKIKSSYLLYFFSVLYGFALFIMPKTIDTLLIQITLVFLTWITYLFGVLCNTIEDGKNAKR